MPEWFDKVVAGGPAVIFAWMWWMERTERQQERNEHKTVSRDMINAMVKTEGTLATIAGLLIGGKSSA